MAPEIRNQNFDPPGHNSDSEFIVFVWQAAAAQTAAAQVVAAQVTGAQAVVRRQKTERGKTKTTNT